MKVVYTDALCYNAIKNSKCALSQVINWLFATIVLQLPR